MELKRRNCGIDFRVSILTQRWQQYSITINGHKHENMVSAAVSNMLGDMINALYEMYPEAHDDSRPRIAEYLCQDPSWSNRITAITASISWDNEGEALWWRLTRQLYEEKIILDIELKSDFDDEDKSYHYQVPFFDMCYAVAKAATLVLKQTGVIGYHYLGETDAIDIHHFLYIKYLGVFEKPIPLIPINYNPESKYSSGDRITSLEDEIALLQFEM